MEINYTYPEGYQEMLEVFRAHLMEIGEDPEKAEALFTGMVNGYATLM